MDWMPQAIRDGIIVVLVISGPLVLAAAFIGLVVGILQAATQVQEQTIGSALKIIGVFALIIVAGFWMYQYLNQYTTRTFANAFTFIPRQTQKAVPSGAFEEEEFQESFKEKSDLEEAFSRPLKAEPLSIEGTGSKATEGGLPPGIPYLGAPDIPKPPVLSKILPPEIKVQKFPKELLKPVVPLADYQEPKPVLPSSPDMNDQVMSQDDLEIEAQDQAGWIE